MISRNEECKEINDRTRKIEIYDYNAHTIFHLTESSFNK